jgi:hypothetical protein
MAKHALEETCGLTSTELPDAVGSRFRLKVAVEGGVAEVQMSTASVFVKDVHC